MHYVPSGREESDLSSVGLFLHDGRRPPRELKQKIIRAAPFVIPPRSEEFIVTARGRFESAVAVVFIGHHMHARGAEMKTTALFPDGRQEVLSFQPFFDGGKGHGAALRTPRLLPKGTVLSVRGAFDNSMRNPHNPDPAAEVRSGLDSVRDEMLQASLQYYELSP